MKPADLGAGLRGYVRIRVTGPAPERFVNLAVSQGHRLWNTRRGPRTIEADVSIHSFRRLRQAARRTRSKVKILERHGFPFLLQRLSRRPLLMAGAIVSLCALYALTSMVWVVQIEGADALDPALIREVAAGVGLRPGVFKATIEPRQVERSMLLAVHGLSWVAVELHGVVALIRVVEKRPLERPELPTPPVDIVAAKDGVITSLVVLAGEAVVKEGDTVRAGDLLIRGVAPAAPPSQAAEGEVPTPAPGGVPVVASGIVKARVWYQAYAEARLHTLTHVPTGKSWRRIALVIQGREVPVWGWWEAPRGLYQRREERARSEWLEGLGFPVEVVTTITTEVQDVRTDLSPEAAEAAARQAASEALDRMLPKGCHPSPYHFEVTTKSGILIGVLATTEVVEDIAQVLQKH